MSIAPVAASISQAKHGSESFKAHTLSQQFENLCRGESFAKEQMAKWKHPKTGLKRDDLMIIESLAYDVMKYFGYEAAHVKTPSDVLQFTEAQVEEFARLNEAGIEQMNEKLKKENIADYNRRIHQAEVLTMGARRLSSSQWSIDDSFKATKKKDTILEKLNESEAVVEYTEKGIMEGFGTFVCGAASQKGYYPSDPMKENQDSFDIRIADGAKNYFFSVYDGHGPDGHSCSRLCKTMIGDIYEEHLSEGCTTKVSITKAHTETHDIMSKSAAINAELSGSTSVIASLKGSTLTIAYAGDSAAVIGSKSNKRSPTLLTNPHDLSRPDEVARIERKGGLVMSTEEYDKVKDHLARQSSNSLARSISSKTMTGSVSTSRRGSLMNRMGSLGHSSHWKQSMSDLLKMKSAVPPSKRRSSIQTQRLDASDVSLNQTLRKVISVASTNSLISRDASQSYVPRIWSSKSVEKVPGCAFTRSLGDTIAHEIGVSEKPEFKQVAVQQDDVIIIASDGVTEYLDATAIVRIVSEIDDPADAARALVNTSAALWAEKNDYCDDITAIVIFINGEDVGSSGIESIPETDTETEQQSSKPSFFRRLVQRRRQKQRNNVASEASSKRRVFTRLIPRTA